MDLATIGFAVNTNPLANATNALGDLGDAGEDAAGSIDDSMGSSSESFKKFGVVAKVVALSVAGAGATIVASMAAISSSFRDTSIIAEMSNQSVNSIDQMSFVYKQFGLEIEQVNDIYKDSRERVGEWLNEQSGELSVFGATMGMTKEQITEFAKEVEDLNGQQLLQRMVDDMQDAGIYGSRMSNVMESMASDATKMIPALKNAGYAMVSLKDRFRDATQSMQLTEVEATGLTSLSASFDLFAESTGVAADKIGSQIASTMDSLVSGIIKQVPIATQAIVNFINSFKDLDNITDIGSVQSQIESGEAKLLNLTAQKLRLTNEFAAADLSGKASSIYEQVAINKYTDDYNQKLLIVNSGISKQADLIKRLKDKRDSLAGGTGGEGGGDNGPTLKVDPAAFTEQKEELARLQLEIGKTSSELFIMSEVNKSIARSDAPALTEVIRAQATALAGNREEQKALAAARLEAKNELLAGQAAEQAWLDNIIASTGQVARLEAEILRVKQAMIGGFDADSGNEYIESLRAQIDDIKSIESPMSGWGKDIDNFTDGINTGLSAMQGMSKKGSKEFKALGVVMAANNAIQAVGAVLNQANGDPYTAFGRMAAMAASVAALGMSVGGLSGGGDADQSKANQEAQGLNIWGDKSESISNSIDITADATDKLVGINTDMLKAMKSVQNGIAGASSLISRDVTTPQATPGSLGVIDPNKWHIDPMEMLGFGFLGDFVGKWVGKFLGGKSSVTDEGIKIIGGSLGKLMEDVTVLSFQSVKYKKWRFGSSKYKTITDDISDQVGSQFELVFRSIADAVFSGATALGLSDDSVTKAINDYNVATQTISLKGLSAEDKQKELNAVFSRIFDGLALSVVDFLPEFQQVGESIGEALARLGLEVQIADLMVSRFGLTFGDKMADPEAYARAADNITTLVGGIEKLAESTASFTKAFASDSQSLAIQQRELSEAFAKVGLELPTTTSGMWELMQSLDGSTEIGQEQIATLLKLTGASESYINLLDKVSKRYTNAIESMFKSSDAVKQIGLDAALAAARLGDMSLADALDLGALNPNQSDFSSFSDFAFSQAVTANKIQELADLSRGTVSEGQQQIDLLAQIADNTVREPASSQAVMKVDTASLNEEIKMLREENKKMSENQAKLTASMESSLKRLLAIEQNKEIA